MYRPSFCCECGERVARARWRAWTSRRFCPSCDRRFRRKRVLTPLALAAALSGTGFLLGRAGRPSAPPLSVERGTLNTVPPPAGGVQQRADDRGRREGTSPKPEPAYGPDGTANERPTDPAEVVYICGARTKKGTPCQRRVRGPFRCWQHRGMPAMLPPSKLVVPG
ncbi:MAG: hypothetical protein DMF67_03730 [Acidobacteria bacterium]|nr:MAG: hypothetical protein DMF67_03730 [Acidobacteriota bacterium]